MGEILTQPPAEEGDDQLASEGTDDVRVGEHDLEDAPELDDAEDEDDDETDG